jgi:hypothetical protein
MLTRQVPPVDIDTIVQRAGVTVVKRAFEESVRATIGDVAGRRSIILNRNYRILSAGERRWIPAEKLGHILLGQHLTKPRYPGVPQSCWRFLPLRQCLLTHFQHLLEHDGIHLGVLGSAVVHFNRLFGTAVRVIEQILTDPDAGFDLDATIQSGAE